MTMDKEDEIKSLKEQLKSLEGKIRGELNKIEALKTRISKGYRRRDKAKYEAERREITENLRKYQEEQETVQKRLSELEAAP